MRAFHQSIRWRLQVWHSLVLLLVLAAFGVTAYWLVRENLFKRVDAELQRRATVVVTGFAPLPRPPKAGSGRQVVFRLSPAQQSLFDDPEPGSFYYIVWVSGGEVRQASPNAPPDVPKPDSKTTSSDAIFRQRGEIRELAVVSRRTAPLGPRVVMDDSPRGIVVVGCSVASTQAELQRLAWWFAAVGGGVFVFGIAIGWVLSARTIKPISAIGAAARNIANGNLSERINLADTGSELGELAGVLNETFDRLQAAFARQVQFTADASHELRTPAFVILSEAQSALKRERSAAEYREGFEVCQRAARQMKQLIESLLILAREDSGGSEISSETCLLDQITREAVALLGSLATGKNVKLHLDLEAAPVVGDARQLGQVAINLVNNAIEYNRPDGEVTVAVKQVDGCAVLTVSDNGPGIPEEHLPHIFERFFRSNSSRSSPGGHAGLGLAICKAILETHGGSIEVSSVVNQGTVFKVSVPSEGGGVSAHREES